LASVAGGWSFDQYWNTGFSSLDKLITNLFSKRLEDADDELISRYFQRVERDLRGIIYINSG